MWVWIGNFFHFFNELVYSLTDNTISLIDDVLLNVGTGPGLQNMQINLILFSETPILTGNLYDLLSLFFSIFYTVIFIVISYKMFRYIFRKFIGAFL